MSAVRIPLFPLEVVLFPGLALPLHIFESRYKLMIRRCLEQNAEFGVVLAQANSIAEIGCTAGIVKVLKTYSDGRMDILTFGNEKFQIHELLRENPYLEAHVEFVAETSLWAETPHDKVLLALFQHCQSLVYGQIGETPDAAAPVSMAYRMASELPLDLEFKQGLLELQSEAERRRRLCEMLEKWIPVLQEIEHRKKESEGTGPAPN